MTWAFSEEINSQLGALEQTRKRLRRAFIIAVSATLLLVLGGVGLWVGAAAFGPSASIAELDIPATVARALSNETSGKRFDSLAGNATFALTSFTETLMPVLKVLSILALLGGMGLSLVNHGSAGTAPVILAFAFAGAVNFGPPVLKAISNEETAEFESPARQIERLSAVPQAVDAKLRAVNVVDSKDSRYVLAQAAVRGGVSPVPEIVGEVAKEQGESPTLSADRQILYALEMASFGEPRSPHARRYAENAGRTEILMVLAAKVLVTLGVLGVFASLASYLLGRDITRRLGRIRGFAVAGNS
ncbi:MAG: hypothetical protein ACK59X_27390 [Acidovorax sp.]